jgi:ubiquitin carboxyl-terminal hydrolase 4/11
MERQGTASREDIWRLQETLTDLSTTQAQHTERIMRLEKKADDGSRPRNVWAPGSPFPSVLGSSQNGAYRAGGSLDKY